MKLVQVEIPKLVYWPLKVLLCIGAAYSLYTIAIDIDNGTITRRGIAYYLEAEPRTFYINLVKRFVIFSVLIWFGTSGTRKKEVSSNGN
ncbi:MAG: hypothetical protein JXQ95_07220 [Alteromonas stellipolaris]|uniref:hypothetical protein n=1 Tax=Alteromonas stellipolaris TaxID=233316 RepID=UPI003B8E3772